MKCKLQALIFLGREQRKMGAVRGTKIGEIRILFLHYPCTVLLHPILLDFFQLFSEPYKVTFNV